MKKFKLSLCTIMLVLPMSFATTMVVGNPVVVEAQSDGTGYYEEQYIWNNIPSKYKKQYEKELKRQGKCFSKSLYKAVMEYGYSWKTALDTLVQTGKCNVNW
ncbi:MAG: hypothetical protein LBE23_11065 [Vagococcus sp.]|nr:hypothetical protein [Vagococcus sp.]